MGLLSWFFPSDDDRVARATSLIAAERWIDALAEVEHLDRDDARGIVHAAKSGLTRLNLEAAVSWGRAGDSERVELHLDLAEELNPGGLDDAFRETRRALREVRAELRADAEKNKQTRDAHQLSVNPLGMGAGSGQLAGPTEGTIATDDEDRAARLALLVENYPSHLQSELERLGPPFATAVLDLDDGRPDLALPALLQLPDDAALVRYERSRCAYAGGDPAAASRELRTFGELAGGHQTIGRDHTGVTLAAWTAESGDVTGALALLRELRKTDANLGSYVFAQLLESTGQLEEAEGVLRKLIQMSPRSDALYLALASVRVRGGHTDAAITALEAAMQQVCDSRGCGYKPPNPDVVRTLATLYLEGSGDAERGLTLADQARESRQGMGWDDAYLDALAQRQRSDPSWRSLAETLWDRTPPDSPQHKRLTTHLAL